MEVLFVSETLRRALSSQSELENEWGKEAANKIALRLQQLAAAPNLAELQRLPGRCRESKGNREPSLAVSLNPSYDLVFHPSANPPPGKPGGGLNWIKIDSITVSEIVHHE